ncbi:MAG: Ig-like domain-containing protein [Actinomycetota bacterium]
MPPGRARRRTMENSRMQVVARKRVALAAAAVALLALPSVPATAADPVLVGAGDIASCSRTQDEATAALVTDIPGTVFTLGDNVYPGGATTDFVNCYDPSWGAVKGRTMPVTGNHDWDVASAAGYFNYFGSAAGDPATGLYSYDVADAWHVVVLNSECRKISGGCGAGSPQDLWLQADLQAAAGRNVIAMWHKPPFTSGSNGGNVETRPLFATLYRYGVELLLTGHAHLYERFAPQTADGVADPALGVREFIVGTGGGESSTSNSTPAAASEVRKTGVFGVLKLTLHADSYDWAFIPIAGQTFTDSGTASVHGAPTAPVAVDQEVLVTADSSAPVTLSAADMQHDPLTYEVVTPPSHGVLSGAAPDLTYAPDPGYRGDDSFTFRANDGSEDSNLATVRLTVTATQNVTVKDFAFTPRTPTPEQGATVRWSFTGPSTHTVRDNDGLGLFDSGSKAPGTSFSYAFGAAGVYGYRCSIHPTTMMGTIKIPVKVAPTAIKGVPLTVTWASAALTGYRYDVQVRPPGSSTWTSWKPNVTTLHGDYTPTLTGTYGFRARLERLSSGANSVWSPIASVSVS